ncbi:putative dihydrolipoamide succinyltransferase, partial [Aureobasidium melanogenum]
MAFGIVFVRHSIEGIIALHSRSVTPQFAWDTWIETTRIISKLRRSSEMYPIGACLGYDPGHLSSAPLWKGGGSCPSQFDDQITYLSTCTEQNLQTQPVETNRSNVLTKRSKYNHGSSKQQTIDPNQVWLCSGRESQKAQIERARQGFYIGGQPLCKHATDMCLVEFQRSRTRLKDMWTKKKFDIHTTEIDPLVLKALGRSSQTNLDAEEHLAGVLDVLLDLDKEGDSFSAVKKTVVVGEGEVHHGADLDLAVNSDGALLDGVETQDGGLGQVDDGSTVERTEDTTVGDGEGTTGHILNGELVVTSLLAKLSNGTLDADHVHRLSIANDGGDETLLGSNSDGDVDVVAVDDGVTTVGTLDGGVDGGEPNLTPVFLRISSLW